MPGEETKQYKSSTAGIPPSIGDTRGNKETDSTKTNNSTVYWFGGFRGTGIIRF
jgi:hypothetical protein